MNILYIHGFGSTVQPNSIKYKTLSTFGNVIGVAPDYTKPYNHVVKEITDKVGNQSIDMVVGTSMGGNMASHIAIILDIPYVAINPSFQPSNTLMKYVSMTKDYYGKPMNLTLENIRSFKDFSFHRNGLIIVAQDDEVIDHSKLISFNNGLGDQALTVIESETGNHRMENIEPFMDDITSHYWNTLAAYYPANDNY